MSLKKSAEISWFAPICDGDDDFLGNRNPLYKSSWENTCKIVQTADKLGYKNVLCPSSFQVGQDSLSFVAAMSNLTNNINFLPAVRCGEIYPPMLARTIATIDHMVKGRLTLNIISSNLPGENLESKKRYERSREVIQILKLFWAKDFVEYEGEYYSFKLPSDPAKPYQINGGPLLYFGGYSDDGIELCAEFCDVYLMWPDKEENLNELIKKVKNKAMRYGRSIKFGLRIHAIVRETEDEARAYARGLISKLDLKKGENIKNRALDSKSLGVSIQNNLRLQSDQDFFAEPNLWTGIGLARSGCGAALVGNPDQITSKIKSYIDMGIDSFILSGYPHNKECKIFGNYVLPHFNNVYLSKQLGRFPKIKSNSPLSEGPRK